MSLSPISYISPPGYFDKAVKAWHQELIVVSVTNDYIRPRNQFEFQQQYGYQHFHCVLVAILNWDIEENLGPHFEPEVLIFWLFRIERYATIFGHK